MGLKIGICGAGRFSRWFIPIFQAHPSVEEVCLADKFPDRLASQAANFGIKRTFGSLDDLCASDVDAVAIFTQRWLHGPQAVQALKAGKHVYSAVPTGVTLEEIAELVDTVKSTGLTYMLGETSYYYPVAIYCRKRFANGDFGRFVYGEGEYIHDMSHFYASFQHSGGDQWRSHASLPPMFYATHSISMVLSVTGARMTDVSCFGFADSNEDDIFDANLSMWDNTFSNETALFRTSDGGACRINELRRIGCRGPRSVRMSMYGTEASYEEQANARAWVTKDRANIVDLTELLAPQTKLPNAESDSGSLQETAVPEQFLSAVHPVERLPQEFLDLPSGHEGSHHFLVLDFIEAVESAKLPPNHVWTAARYCAPGLVAHESAKRGGELMKVPDFGDPPT